MLALDTATPAVTVAVHDGDRVLAEHAVVDAMHHGELLGPGIAAVLTEAGVESHDLTDVAVGVGPGPFTGLRVGLVTARTLSAVLDLRLHGVCTLDVIAADAQVAGPFLVATDARRKEVYWSSYAAGGLRVDGPHVAKPATIATDAAVVGRGATLYPESFPHAAGPQDPSAATLADLVVREAVTVLPAEPLYLRRPDVMAPVAPKPVS
jgi:tRNA threonylcarbamoyladenosine biosynthesis protein TsaB